MTIYNLIVGYDLEFCSTNKQTVLDYIKSNNIERYHRIEEESTVIVYKSKMYNNKALED